MKVAASALLPILRSDTVGDILARLFLNPDTWLTPTQLANGLDVSLPTVIREIDRMLDSRLLTEERVGRARRVRANQDNPLYRPLTDLVTLTYGPKPVLEQQLSNIAGIDHAYIYGSWAARYSGETGRPPNDVDVLVVGTADRDEIFDAAQKAGRLLAREVNVNTIRPGAWAAATPRDPFLRHVKTRPLVELDLQESSR